MKTTRELKEARKTIYDSMHEMREALTDENPTMTPEQKEAWDRSNADFNRLTQEIEEADKMDRAAGIMGAAGAAGTPGAEPGARSGGGDDAGGETALAPAAKSRQFRMALNGWARASRGIESAEERQAMQALGFMGGQISIRLATPGNERMIMSGAELRAMSTSGTAVGEEFVPTDFRNQLEIALLDFGAMREQVSILRTSDGRELPMPTMNDTGTKGAQVSELSDNSGTSGTDPATATVTLNAYKFISNDAAQGPVFVSQELMEDSAFNMAALIPQALGMRLGRIQNERMTTGTGSSTVQGIVPAATLGRTAAGATAITYEDVLRLFYSVGSAYRRNAKFMLNDTILPDLRLITDDAGQYIFHPALSETTGEVMLGRPIVVNNDMASAIVASASTILCGDLTKYILREVAEIRIYRLVERFRLEKDADAFVAYMRFDGDILDAGTNPVKKLVQAAGS